MKRMSKSLLCGVIATSFLLMNCQKAPNRPVTADKGAPNGNAASSDDMGNCSDDIVKLIQDQGAAIKAMDGLSKNLTALKATTPMTPEVQTQIDALKLQIETKANELDTLTKGMTAKIRAIKVGDQAGIGCNEVKMVDGKPGKPAPHKISELIEDQRRSAKHASTAVGKRLAGSPEPRVEEAGILVLGDKLAEAFSDDKNVSDISKNKIGLKFIQDGALKDSANDGSEYKKAAEDKAKASCLITTGNSAAGVEAGAEATVTAVAPLTDAASKRNQLLVSFSVADDASTAAAQNLKMMLGITCNIPDGAEDAAAEVRKALGNLVSEKTAPPASGPASGDPTTPISGDPTTPISGDPTTPISGDPTTPISGDPTTPISGDPTTPISGDPTTPIPDEPPPVASGDPSTAAGRAAQARHADLLAAQRAQAASQAMTILTRAQRAQ